MKTLLLLFCFMGLSLFGNNNEQLLNPNQEVYDFTFKSNDIELDTYNPDDEIDKIVLDVEKITGYLPRSYETDICVKDENSSQYECKLDMAKCECPIGETLDIATGTCRSVEYADKINTVTTTSTIYNKIIDVPNVRLYYSSLRQYSIFNFKGSTGGTINRGKIAISYGTWNYRQSSYESLYGSTINYGNYKISTGLRTGKYNNSAEWSYLRIYIKACPSGYSLSGTTCKKTVKTCPSGYGEYGSTTQCKKGTSSPLIGFDNRKCSKVGDKYYSSPYVCNNNNECGYGKCEDDTLSTTAENIIPYSRHPIKALLRSGDACTATPCTETKEYDDGTATLVDRKKCDSGTLSGDKCIESVICNGTIVDGKCKLVEYANKISTTNTVTYNATVKNTTKCVAQQCEYYIGSGENGVEYDDEGNPIESGTGNLCCIGGECWATPPQKCTTTTSYTCPSGGTLKGTTCTKTETTLVCPNGYTSYNSTQCIKTVTSDLTCPNGYELNGTTCERVLDESYTYYTYQCKNEVNEFGNNWILTKDNKDPGCVDDTFGGCISFSRESTVCERQTLGCTNGTCENTGNGFMCSLSACEEGKLPCYGQFCDLATYDRQTYCELQACPEIEGVYEENGECKILSCPDGTYEANGVCVKEN